MIYEGSLINLRKPNFFSLDRNKLTRIKTFVFSKIFLIVFKLIKLIRFVLFCKNLTNRVFDLSSHFNTFKILYKIGKIEGTIS